MINETKVIQVMFLMFLVVMFAGTSYAKYQSRNSGSHVYHSTHHYRKG